MIGSYFSVALRHLSSEKLYSAINILGLAVGLACFILIALFVRHELGYDRHFENADRIYRISRDFFGARAAETSLATIAGPAAALLEQDFPQVERAARVSAALGGAVVGLPDGQLYHEPGFATADNALFEIFAFDWLSGDPATALAEPYSVVLTRSAAVRYFGAADVVGETVLLENEHPIRVTGVIEDLGDDTHLSFTMLGSLLTTAAVEGDLMLTHWGFNRYHTYVLLAEGADIDTIEAQSGEFFERHFMPGSSGGTRFVATPLTRIHLHSNRLGEMRPPGSIATVYTFSAIAVFVLLIACINFVNLATARSSKRAKEIGVRKTVGAGQAHVIVQFLSESVLLALLAVVLAVTLVELSLPAFNRSLDLNLVFDYFGDPVVAAGLLMLTLSIGLAAGAYPAFYLAAFDPTRVLRGDVARGGGAPAFRRALVVVQFSISIALLIGTAVVYQQMRFASDLELGYQREHIVVVDGSLTRGFGDQWATLKQEWLAHPEIMHVTASNLTPSMQNSNALGIRVEGGDPEGGAERFLWVDYGFFETYGIEVLAGRTFSEDYGGDRLGAQAGGNGGAYVLNALAARKYGWAPDEAIGKWLELLPGQNRGPVIGVVADVYLESVRTAIAPLVYMIPPEEDIGYVPLAFASLRISGRNLADTLDHIDRTWTELVPDQPVSRRFLDRIFAALYAAEERQARVFTAFSVLAILIACLGLLGLTAFAIEQRTKEIGVRKVMGGTVLDIVRLFTGEFGKLVLVANLIAWPVAYVLMQRWLENFAYRIELNGFVFIASALLALAVALLTVGTIAARAAAVNPIHSLRYE